MKNLLLIFILFVTLSIISISCQDVSQPTYDPSILKGYVVDANTLTALDSVLVTLSDFSLSTGTDNSGYFQFLYIQMPRDPMGANIVATKNGYKQIENYISLKSDDTTKVNIIMVRQ
jgi:hypothetical protein